MPTVLLIAEDASLSASLRGSLQSLGYAVVAELRDVEQLQTEVVRAAPNLIILCTERPSERTLHALRNISEVLPRPILVFASDSGRASIRRSIEAGVAAYVVDGWAPERLTA